MKITDMKCACMLEAFVSTVVCCIIHLFICMNFVIFVVTCCETV